MYICAPSPEVSDDCPDARKSSPAPLAHRLYRCRSAPLEEKLKLE